MKFLEKLKAFFGFKKEEISTIVITPDPVVVDIPLIEEIKPVKKLHTKNQQLKNKNLKNKL